MKKLEIKSIFVPEIDDLTQWRPISDDDLFTLLHIDIGQVNELFVEYFYVTLVTPNSLKKYGKPFSKDRRLLVVPYYDLDLIHEMIANIVKQCTCSSWDESCQRLSEHFYWEHD